MTPPLAQRVDAAIMEARTLKQRARRYLAMVPPCVILVVEDEPLSAKAIVAALVAAGLVAENVPTIAGARDRLKRRDVGAVIVDQGLPDGDGWTFAGEVAHAIPVALMSAKLGPADLDALKARAGSNAVVDATQPAAMVATVRSMIERKGR